MIDSSGKEDAMSETTLECQGLPCPQPVLKCKDAVERMNPEHITVVVDNEPAKENVSRFLGTRGYATSVREAAGEYYVSATRTAGAQEDCPDCRIMADHEIAAVGDHKILVFVSSDAIGSGDDNLGAKLMFNFLSTLKELGSELWRIVMVNGAVRLAATGNPCLEPLQALEKDGVSILVCGTCLEHFGLTGQRQVGQVTNMLDVVTSFQLATKTVHV
jgi:selenium metabolism protein YedF